MYYAMMWDGNPEEQFSLKGGTTKYTSAGALQYNNNCIFLIQTDEKCF